MMVPNTVIKRRLVILLLFSLLLSFALMFRVFWIQFVKSEELREKAQIQWTRDVPVEPKRGAIYDRNKKPLAISATVDTVMASPPDIKDIHKTAKLLASALDLDESELEKNLMMQKEEKSGIIYKA